MLGLYVHIPFCAAICNYCNFNRGLFDEGLKQRYVQALIQEIRAAGEGVAADPADTIFFGGGTPSLLEPAEVAAIIAACRESYALAPDAEITLEANPETVTAERLAGFRAAGINRLSFGVQSFRDEELARLSRLHSASKAAEAFGLARAAGFDNISLDLMMWLPQQTVGQWLESIDALIDLGPDHASMYLLEIYPNAPLRDAMARGQWSVAPDDDAAEMYLSGLDRMDSAGYVQYEISNVSRPGRASRHNLKYWQDGEWRGFGCGAHSTVYRNGSTPFLEGGPAGLVRWKNLASTVDYIAAVGGGQGVVAERRTLSAEERLEDALFTGLRLTGGIDVEAVQSRYGIDVWRQFGEELQVFVDERLLIYDGGSLRLSRPGMLLANEIMAVFIRSTVR